MSQKYKWAVVAYERRGDRHLATYPLPVVDLVRVREALGAANDATLEGCFPIPPAGVRYFEKLLGRVFDQANEEYFFEIVG